MDDDIVTRLRNKYQGQLPILLEAADEIERLRASVINTFDNGFDEIERLRTDCDKASALISKLAELLVPFSMLMNKHEQEMLIKVVRGE